MTVKELIAELQELDGDLTLIIQKDPEGNEYSPLVGVAGGAYYVPDSTWSGTVYGQEDIDSGDAPPGGQPVAVVWPVN
jgi:hypothetical protein